MGQLKISRSPGGALTLQKQAVVRIEARSPQAKAVSFSNMD